VVNVIKFWFTFNFLLLKTLAMMHIFLSSYKKRNRDNDAGSRKDVVCKKLSCSMIQNICLLDSQILMLMEKRGHNIYFA